MPPSDRTHAKGVHPVVKPHLLVGNCTENRGSYKPVPNQQSHHVSSLEFRISCLFRISSLGFRISPDPSGRIMRNEPKKNRPPQAGLHIYNPPVPPAGYPTHHHPNSQKTRNEPNRRHVCLSYFLLSTFSPRAGNSPRRPISAATDKMLRAKCYMLNAAFKKRTLKTTQAASLPPIYLTPVFPGCVAIVPFST